MSAPSEMDLKPAAEEAALQFLVEIEDVKREIRNCADKLETRIKVKQELQQEEAATAELLLQKTQELESKKRKVTELKFMLDQAAKRVDDVIQPWERAVHVHPGEVVFKLKSIQRKYEQEEEEFAKTGSYKSTDVLIQDVRATFNLCMEQLNELNKKNRAVTKMLESLRFLDDLEVKLRKRL